MKNKKAKLVMLEWGCSFIIGIQIVVVLALLAWRLLG